MRADASSRSGPPPRKSPRGHACCFLAGRSRVGSLLGLGWLALLAACFQSEKPPNVILISIDTLRVDHTGLSGSAVNLTPNLDRLARESQVWGEAYCPQTWTLTSHMSVFTGLYPGAHGLSHKVGLAPGIPTLPQILQQNGWRTGGFVHQCHFLDAWYGFDRGMDTYQVTQQAALDRNRDALAWVRQDTQKPLFLMVHYYDAHSSFEKLPYGGPGPFQRLYPPASEATDEELAHCFPRNWLRDAFLDPRNLSESELDLLKSLYQSGVRYADHALGDLLGGLEELGVLENALIVVISDHGEELLEHGGLIHEQPYDEVRRVVSLLRFPGKSSARVHRTPTMNVDLLPTILDAMQLKAPAHIQGVSLLGQVPQRPMRTLGISPVEAVWTGRYGLVTNEGQGYGRAYRPHPTDQLFDLWADPAEKHDLSATRPALLERVRDGLRLLQESDLDLLEFLPKPGDAEQRELSPEQREGMQGIGYMTQ